MNTLCKRNLKVLLSSRACGGSCDWLHTSPSICALNTTQEKSNLYLDNWKVSHKINTKLLNSWNSKHIYNLPFLRHYSQEKFQDNGFSKPIKWLMIVSCGGLAGGLIYKLIDSQKTSSLETNKDDGTEEKKGKENVLFKMPENSSEIPSNIPYLLIGGGTASFSAFRAIKATDPTAKVLIITEEPYFPYMRPPLTKELIYNKDRELAKILRFSQWNGSERSVFFEPQEFYLSCDGLKDSETGGVSVVRGWKVVELNPELKYVILEDGKRIDYNKCLLATGATPKNLPVFTNSIPKLQEKVTVYRSLHDFYRLETALEKGAKTIAIVGGGFTGSELACSLARRGIQVVQIYKEESNMSQVLPSYLSSWLTWKIESQGIKLFKNTEIKDVKLLNEKIQINTNSNESIQADFVVVAAGVEPNTNLAMSAGLEVDHTIGGYVVNAELEARSDLFVAGDCACFYDKKLGRRRVEHHDHAVVSGRLAGENMTGAGKPYAHQSMFWSDFGPDLGFEAIGVIDSSLPTVAVYFQKSVKGKEEENGNEVGNGNEVAELPVDKAPESPKDEFQKGVVFYLKNEMVVGMVMWNLFNRISIARQVLKSNIKLEDLKEVAKLFHLNTAITE